jgi:hypothetical protein
MFSAGFKPQHYEGVFDPAKGTLEGQVGTGPDKGTFTLSRNTPKTNELQARFAKQTRLMTQGPVALAAAKTDEARTFVLVRWLHRFKLEYPDINVGHSVTSDYYSKMINLFMDADFVPVFGKPFDAMKPDELSYPRQLLFVLAQSEKRPLLEGFAGIIDHPFTPEQGSFAYYDVAPQVAFRRGQYKQWQEMLENLKALPNNSAGYTQIATLRAMGEKTFEDLWPSQVRQFRDAIDATKHRLAEAALKERIEAAITNSRQLQDIALLRKPVVENQELFGLVPADARSAVDARIDLALTDLLETEERTKPIAGTGLAAVLAGNAWYARLKAEYGFAQDRDPVKRALERLVGRRAADLSGAAATIIAEIGQQPGKPLLDKVMNTYLAVPGDDDTEAGHKIAEAMKARLAAIKREEMLANFSPNERKWVQDDGRIAIPSPVPEPDAEDLRVAVVRSLARMGGERVRPYAVHFHNTFARGIGYYIVAEINSVERQSCVPAGTGYDIGYKIKGKYYNPPSIDFRADSQLGMAEAALLDDFERQFAPDSGRTDHFELSSSGWSSPSMESRGIESGNPLN